MSPDEAADVAIQLDRWSNHQPLVDEWMALLEPLDHAIAVRAYTRLLERPVPAGRHRELFRAEYDTCQRRADRPLDPTDPRRLSPETIALGNAWIAKIRAQLAERTGA